MHCTPLPCHVFFLSSYRLEYIFLEIVSRSSWPSAMLDRDRHYFWSWHSLVVFPSWIAYTKLHVNTAELLQDLKFSEAFTWHHWGYHQMFLVLCFSICYLHFCSREGMGQVNNIHSQSFFSLSSFSCFSFALSDTSLFHSSPLFHEI